MFYRKFNLFFQDIIIIGAGGTGSRVIAPLVQTIKASGAKLNPRLYIVDGDIVELKNLSRQNFISKDIGRKKALVLAERYGAALDFPISAHCSYVTDGGNMMADIAESSIDQGILPPTNLRKLIIMCVDTVDARLCILRQCGPTDIIIDSGNEDTFGQVSIFDKISMPHLQNRNEDPIDLGVMCGEYELPFIPAPITAYLNALINPSKATGSCADLDQSLAVNFQMAAGIISMVQSLAYNNKVYCRTNYFDIIKGNTSERMTTHWFNQCMNETSSFNSSIITHWSSLCAYTLVKTPEGVPDHHMSDHGSLTTRIVNDIHSKVKFVDEAILRALGQK